MARIAGDHGPFFCNRSPLLTRQRLSYRHGAGASPVGVIDIEPEALPDRYVGASMVMKLTVVTEQELAALTVDENHATILNCVRDCHGLLSLGSFGGCDCRPIFWSTVVFAALVPSTLIVPSAANSSETFFKWSQL